MEKSHSGKIRYGLLAAILIFTALLFVAALARIRVDTDVVTALPGHDRVIADAVYLFTHHPVQDRIAMDLALDRDDPDLLVTAARRIEAELTASGLFKNVGMGQTQAAIPELICHIQERLPFLLSAEVLEREVLPRLSIDAVHARLGDFHRRLTGLEGIGQAAAMALDPLGIAETRMATLRFLAPVSGGRIHQGYFFSSDGRHLLLTAVPAGSGTDTDLARRISSLLTDVASRVNPDPVLKGAPITLTPVGAYRSALDNETLVRVDVRNALLFSTLGIAVLLAVTFPRPLVGLLALLPAIFGTAAALFVFSLFKERISIMALGFGGAIISITVDVGISYLLFVDRPYETRGKAASREVWAVGFMAVLTTVGAFLCLGLTGFPIFAQMGVFTALGAAFSFLFVHTVFPVVFDTLPPARMAPRLVLHRIVDRLSNVGPKGPVVALILGCGFAFAATPKFDVSLSAMNTVSPQTRAAEQLFADVWGDVFCKVYLMTEADTLSGLREKNDRLDAILRDLKAEGRVEAAFSLSDLYPGPDAAARNHAAWIAFWTHDRVTQARDLLAREGRALGFSEGAFNPFLSRIAPAPSGLGEKPPDMDIPNAFFDVFAISQDTASGLFRQVTTVTPGPSHDGKRLSERVESLARVFDSELFSKEMGQVLFDTFTRMLLYVGGAVTFMIFISFLDLKLTVLSLLPVAFAFCATLGTLNLLGRPLDIPALMLSIIIFGMGVDYALFFVKSHQRYQDYRNPHFSLIRMSVFMTAASTLVGFGVLFGARHALLKSAGLTSFLGIFYSLLGTVLIIPPILKRRFEGKPIHAKPLEGIRERILWRFRNVEAHHRLFARFKTRLDPMFGELDGMVDRFTPPRTILDIGTGYGVVAAWFAERFPGVWVRGIEPDPDRVRVAGIVLGEAGCVSQGLAPEIPEPESPTQIPADLALLIDMTHYLDDAALSLTLRRLNSRLRQGGAGILIRMAPPPPNRWTLGYWVEQAVCWKRRIRPRYRSVVSMETLLCQAGFQVTARLPSGSGRDLVWVMGVVEADSRLS